MATKTKSKKRFPEMSPEVRQELLSKIDAQLLCTALEIDHLPKGVLGVCRVDVVDFEDDDVALHYVVYDDYVDLDDTDTVPKLDIIKAALYFYRTVTDRFARIMLVNFSDLPKTLETAGSY